jgi:PAS domain S-box-containing protein
LASEVATEIGFPEERVFDITVASSEAIANAIEHSPVKGAVEVRTILHSDRLEIEVQGPGEFQAPDRTGAIQTRGLGLPLMAKLSDHLALFSGPRGETFVSLTFYLPGVDITGEGAVAPSFANLAEENRLLDDVLRNFPEGFYVLDPDWRIIYLNPAVAQSLGKTPDELLGVVIWEEFPEREADSRALLERALATHSTISVTTHDQRGFWRESTVFPVEEGLAVISRDVTERKRAEETLRESEERFRTMFEGHGAPMLLMEPDSGRIHDANEAAARFYGYTREQLRAMNITQINELPPQEVAAERRKAVNLSQNTFVFRHRLKDGTRRWVEVHSSPVEVHGMPLLFSIIHDITDRKAAEEALKESQEAEEQLKVALSRELLMSRRLLETAETLADWTDLASILERLVALVVEMTGHSRAGIGLYDPDLKRIRVAASAGVAPMKPASAPLSSFSSAMQEVIKTGRSILVDYDQLPESERQIARTYNTRYALLVPLVYREQVLGVIMVDDPVPSTTFTEEDRRLIEGIGAQAAVAIENARLYEAQRNIAEQLQEAILEIPAAVSNLSFGHLYRSATEGALVGGDFYDILELNHDLVGLVIGDVSGHGVNAARTAGMVKSSVAALAADRDDPSTILASVNRLLVDRSVPGFTSVLFALYRPSTGLLTHCSAGHPNLLLGHADGQVELIGQNHPPLGVFASWSCSIETTHVEPQDTLLLYTDGLTEARAGREMFGEGRLSDTFAKHLHVELDKMPQAILDDVLAFTGGRLRDDVAILAVRPGATAGISETQDSSAIDRV